MSENGFRVLLLEDDEGLARLCAKNLGRKGFDVTVERDGLGGIELCRSGDFDIVVSDNEMPGCNGLEVLRRLSDEGIQPAFIMVTGAGNEEMAVEAMRLGALDYLVKDVDGHYLDMLAPTIERALRQYKTEEHIRLADKVFECASEGIMVTDRDKRIVRVNDALCRITGRSREELIGESPRLLQSGRQNDAFYKEMWETLSQSGNWSGEIWNRRRDGAAFPAWLRISAVEDRHGQITHYVGMLTDITARKEAENRLEFLATHDPLTGIPNRVLFLEHVAQAIALANRHQGRLAVMLLDLDHFKEANDTLGHRSGDIILISAAHRMIHCLRKTDVVARLGGDEFTVLLCEIRSDADIAAVADRIVKTISRTFPIGTQRCNVSASVGIAVYPGDGETSTDLIKMADAAMYVAKEERNRYVFARDVSRSASA